jgi:dihydroxy-acid dehydratase
MTVDAETRQITAHLTDAEWAARRKAWKAPPLKVSQGSLYKYTKLVGSASEGCMTDL